MGVQSVVQSWENALTDTDGAYCELMAGSYSDNQPDFTWLEPMETKTFSQYWFPIGEIGVPDFANTTGAIYVKDAIKVQLNKTRNVKITVRGGDRVLFSGNATIKAREEYSLPADVRMKLGYSIDVTANDGTVLMSYTVKKHDTFNIPHTTQDMPMSRRLKVRICCILKVCMWTNTVILPLKERAIIKKLLNVIRILLLH
jgi:hypothetical protein